MRASAQAFLSLALAFVPQLQAAEPQIRPGLQPLFRMHSEILTPASFPVGTEFILEQRDIFVSKDGLTNSLLILRGEGRFRTALMRGTSSPNRLRDLVTALGSARAGAQGDCQIANGLAGGGFYDVYWYGKAGRTNEFRITVTSQPLAGIQNCPDAVADLILSVLSFDNALSEKPDTQILWSN